MQTTNGTEYSTITPDGTVKHADGADFAYLPAPTVQSHAANLLTLPDGRLGCVWFGGTQEGVPDISIWFSTLEPGSTQWSPAEQLSDDGARSEQNPILFTAPDTSLWLLYTAQKAGNQDTAEVRRRTSTDSGRTWGPVETLFAANETGGVFVRQLPVALPSGRPDHPDLPLHHHTRRKVGGQQRRQRRDDFRRRRRHLERARPAGQPGLRPHEHPAGGRRLPAGPVPEPLG